MFGDTFGVLHCVEVAHEQPGLPAILVRMPSIALARRIPIQAFLLARWLSQLRKLR
jgi:hypothetical protein